jgi:hypothetical protein
VGKFDPAKFNTDPKHQEERDFLDAIVEESAKRISKKLKEKTPPDEGIGGFFDFLKGGD